MAKSLFLVDAKSFPHTSKVYSENKTRLDQLCEAFSLIIGCTPWQIRSQIIRLWDEDLNTRCVFICSDSISELTRLSEWILEYEPSNLNQMLLSPPTHLRVEKGVRKSLHFQVYPYTFIDDNAVYFYKTLNGLIPADPDTSI